jgi:signal transduction histidine kinase/CheY-like chemotaxis protein
VASAIGVEEKRKHAEEGLATRTKQLEAVRAVTTEISRELDLATVLDLITRRAMDLVGASSAVLRFWHEETGLLVPQSRIGVEEPRGTGTLNFRLGEGVAGSVAERRQGLVVNDFRHSPYATPALLARTTHTAVLSEPLLYRDRLVGVINLNREEPGQPFTEEDRQLLALLATQAAIAIENARSHAAAVRRGEELAALLRATRSVMTGLDLHASLERIAEEAARIAGTPHVKVLLLNRETRALWVGAVVGRPPSPSLFAGRPFPPGISLSGIVAETGQPLFVPESQNDPRNILAEEDRQLGFVTYLGLPIRIREEVLGVMTFNTTAPRQYGPDELAYLTSFAAQAAIAIENARLYADLKRAYEDVQRAQDGLIRAEKLRALGQMAAGIAHDLNNVLAAILAHVELLRLQAREPKVRERLAMLETTATDGAQIVRRLQGFARQQPTGPLIPCDLAALVQEVVEFTRPRWRDEFQRRGAVIEMQLALEALPPILGQPAEIREVLTNLILNALDAMPEGGRLTLAGNATPAGVTLTVADTGAGMSEEVRQRIFDPFFTTKGGQGTGLGLSVVYAVMQRHGGHIDVTSTPGAGSSFTLRFRAAPAVLPVESDTPPPPGPPRRILLIDDNPMVCQTVASLLRTAGHTVKEAESGAAGLAAFAEFPVDLVLTDLGMPDVNGWDVARAVKGRDPHLPVVLLTGWGEQPNGGDAGESATRDLVDRVISKPFRLRDLLAAIAELTDSASSRRRANPVGP